MSEQAKRLVPKLRFPEFENSGAWIQVSIAQLCETFSGGTPTSTEKSFYGGEVPFIRSAEIASNATELFLTDAGLKKSSAKMVNEGDVLVALYGANSGDVAISRVNGAINQAILCLQSDTESRNRFIYQYLTYKKNYIVGKYIQGGQGNLSGEIVKSIGIPQPPKISNEDLELKKVADCLSSLDDLITAQNQKVEALKQYKKGLMQQLFPAEGETVPKLRFPEFENDGDWSNLNLTDIAKTSIGLVTTMTTSYSTQGVPLIRNSDIQQNKVRKEELIYLLDSFADKYPGKKLRTGDIVTVHTGDIGVSSLIDDELNGCLGFATLNTRIIKSDVIPQYLCWYFNSERYISFAISMATGDGRNNFNLSDFNRSVIPVPSKPEQQKISDFLTNIDNLITFQTKSLETLKTHKKGLMQQLFPLIDEVVV